VRFELKTVSAAETSSAAKNPIASTKSRSFSSTALRYCFTSRPKMMRIERRVPVNQLSATHSSEAPATTLVQSRARACSSVPSGTAPSPFSPSSPGTNVLIWVTSESSSSGRPRSTMPKMPNPTQSPANTANSA
jgi:hypothetical protein